MLVGVLVVLPFIAVLLPFAVKLGKIIKSLSKRLTRVVGVVYLYYRVKGWRPLVDWMCWK